MRGKRIAVIAGCLALVVAGFLVAVAIPLLVDLWYLRRLRTESSLLETALIDPKACRPSAVERYLKTEQGRDALFEPTVRVAEDRFSSGGSHRYKSKGFRRAIFFVHGEKAYSWIMSKAGCVGGGSKLSNSSALLRGLHGYLAHLEGFSYELSQQAAWRFTVIRAGEAGKMVGYYLRFEEDGSIRNYVAAQGTFDEKGMPETITGRDINLMNQSFALVVEPK